MALHETSCADCWKTLTKVTCDVCRMTEDHHGDIHSISEFVRSRGWTTGVVINTPFTDPLRWLCPRCRVNT